MDKFLRNITDKIINYGLGFIAVISLPLNVIIYFAISNSQCIVIKILPFLLALLTILLYFYRNKISLRVKTRIFSLLLFSAGLYTLTLGLLDMAALWFILSIIFALFDTQKNIAFAMFIVALLFTITTGLFMISKNPYFPLDYGFENCQFACVSIRIINFLIIGFLIFKILRIFFKTIELYISEIVEKNLVLEKLKEAEKQKSEQKLKNLVFKKNIEKQELELYYKRKELANAFSKLMKFNNLLESIKKEISAGKYKDALVSIRSGQSKNYNIEAFRIRFNEVYPDFIIKLGEIYPQLSETDVNVCVLTIAGLKSSEIADLLNVSEATIGKYRNRIRKKLHLENNADIAQHLLKKLNYRHISNINHLS
ncbi:MAG: helix-turn-helix transcriptional regulator [Bacteroidales bacterium]